MEEGTQLRKHAEGERRKGKINRVEVERDQTSSMGLFLGILQASTTLSPVLRTVTRVTSDNVSREKSVRTDLFWVVMYLIGGQYQILYYQMFLRSRNSPQRYCSAHDIKSVTTEIDKPNHNHHHPLKDNIHPPLKNLFV